jgi:hypothetical protein
LVYDFAYDEQGTDLSLQKVYTTSHMAICADVDSQTLAFITHTPSDTYLRLVDLTTGQETISMQMPFRNAWLTNGSLQLSSDSVNLCWTRDCFSLETWVVRLDDHSIIHHYGAAPILEKRIGHSYFYCGGATGIFFLFDPFHETNQTVAWRTDNLRENLAHSPRIIVDESNEAPDLVPGPVIGLYSSGKWILICKVTSQILLRVAYDGTLEVRSLRFADQITGLRSVAFDEGYGIFYSMLSKGMLCKIHFA